MKRFALMFIALFAVSMSACAWAPANGYQGGQLHQAANMPRTGLQEYRPNLPRFVGVAAILSLGCVAPNGWEAAPQKLRTDIVAPQGAPGLPQDSMITSKSESPLGNASINPVAPALCRQRFH